MKLMTTTQIRKEAIRRGYATARKLAEEAPVSIGTAHKILTSDDGEDCLHESVLRRMTEFFEKVGVPV